MTSKIEKHMLLPYVAILFILGSFIVQHPLEVLEGFWKIQINPSILLSDYILIGGLGATLLNSGLLMLISYLIVKQIGVPISGPIFAGILTIGGFAFFGKNLVNVAPVYFGVRLFARYKKLSMKSVIVVLLFSSGIAPVTSLFMFGLGFTWYVGIPLGFLVGVFSGFLLVELASNIISFHRGFDLYNVGFAGGILAILYFGIIQQTKLSYTTTSDYSTEYHWVLIGIVVSLCLIFLLVGYFCNNKTFHNYQNILNKSGRAITDFTRPNRHAITLVNVGLTGLLVLVFVMVLGIPMSGPVFGGLLTVLGFAAFGKHIKNVLPQMIGVLVSALLLDMDITSLSVALAIIFSTGMAPITGEYGFIPGFIAGVIHLPIVFSFSRLHGGILLYSNGFSAAFTALIVYTTVHTLKRSNE